jgi:hypothetical protein
MGGIKGSGETLVSPEPPERRRERKNDPQVSIPTQVTHPMIELKCF